MALIARTNEIEGALTDSPIRTVTVTLTAAQVQALNATPVTLLAAPRSGTGYAILGVYMNKEAGAYALGSAVNIAYTDAGSTAIATLAAANFTGSNATVWATRAAQTGLPSAQTIPNAGVDIQASGAAFTGTGDPVEITVRYVHVDV